MMTKSLNIGESESEKKMPEYSGCETLESFLLVNSDPTTNSKRDESQCVVEEGCMRGSRRRGRAGWSVSHRYYHCGELV